MGSLESRNIHADDDVHPPLIRAGFVHLWRLPLFFLQGIYSTPLPFDPSFEAGSLIEVETQSWRHRSG